MAQRPPSFYGLRVAAFASRRSDDFARLITRWGGVPHVAAALREIPTPTQVTADFVQRLLVGEIGVVAFLTGAGFQHLRTAVARHVVAPRYLSALADSVTIARGLKVAQAMREAGVPPTHIAPRPHTWREVLQTIDQAVPVDNQVVAVQICGNVDVSLVAGLEARGARVVTVSAYRWDLPADRAPLERAVRALVAGDREVALFTAAVQVRHVVQVAHDLGVEAALRQALARAVVGAIGPATSDMLRRSELPVDVEPARHRMEHLVRAAALQADRVRRAKRRVSGLLAARPVATPRPPAPWHDGPFLRACRREPTPITPIWLMRQAGRYMAEYRRVRDKVTFLELCRNPALCSEVMCTAVQRLGVDAAIVFSDLLPILEPMGLDLEFAPHGGPVIHNPVREAGEVDRVVELESVDALDFVMQAVRQTRQDLPASIPLIGFAGAPFTLASYTIEGGSSRTYLHTKTLMYRDPGAWHALMERLARAVTRYLNAQIAAGAQAVQLFDSWVGCLSAGDYRRFVLPYVRQVIAGLRAGTPVINFATGNPALNPLLAEAGGDVIGVDWRQPLAEAWRAFSPQQGIQGNLDPCALLTDRAALRARVREILDQAGGRPGHIFNLGHGVLPQTPVDHAIALVDAVHELSDRSD